MRRFYVPAATIAGDLAVVEGALAHRMTKVLRLRAGDECALFDGNGSDVIVKLRDVSDRRVVADVTGAEPSPQEPKTRVHLFQSITKGERFEWLIEKATEIGVARVTPLVTSRAVVKTSSEGNRIERWRRIATEAAEQCGRGAVPPIESPMLFEAALEAASGVALLPYEEAGNAAPSVGEVLRERIDELYAAAEVSIFIGPEGGLEQGEVDRAEGLGATVVTLGERVLRSETAGLVALTLTLQSCGELG